MCRFVRSALALCVTWLCVGTNSWGQTQPPPATSATVLGTATKPDDNDIDTTPYVAFSAQDRQGFRAAVAALQAPVRGMIFEAPLNIVLESLQADAGVRLMIDHRGLENAACATDSLVNCGMERARLRDVLDEILRPLNLTWVPQPVGIVITGADEINPAYRPVVVYPVLDLVAVRFNGRIEYDFDSLIDAITSTVHPLCWKDSGTGEGTIVPGTWSASLVVSESWQTHEAVEAMLAGLRAAKRQQRLGGVVVVSGPATAEVEPDRYRYRPPASRRQRVRWSFATP